MLISVLFASIAVAMPIDTTKIHHLEGVVIERSHVSENVSSAGPIQILDRQHFSVLGVTDIADALHRLPGVNLKDYGGAGGMKTVSVRGFGTQHTGVSYDGIILGDGQSGQVDLSRYSLGNLSQIALSVVDGSDIFIPARNVSKAALLNINTLQMPTHRQVLSGEVKMGSYGLVNPFVRWQQRISEKLGISLMADYLYADNNYPYTIQNGMEKVHDRRQNSRMNSAHGELNFLWKDGRHQLNGKLYYYDNKRLLPGIVRYYTNLNRESLHERNAFGQFTYEYLLSSRWQMKWNAKVDWAETKYIDGNYPDGINDGHYWQREYYVNMCLLWKPAPGWTADYSVDYSHANLNSTKLIYGLPYRNSLLQTVALNYRKGRLQAVARMLHSLYLNGNKNGYAADDMKRFSPSLSLSWRLLQQERLFARLSFKNIFRAPSFSESYFAHHGSRALKPESTDQLNVGLTFEKSDSRTHLVLTADGYLNHVKDKIISIPYNMFIWQNINLGKVEMLGLDVAAHWERKLHHRHTLTAAVNYSYLRAANHTLRSSDNYGLQIAYTPEHSGNIALGWQNPWVNLSLNATGATKRWATTNHYDQTDLSSYLDVGATLYRTFALGKHQLNARFDMMNLFHTQYEIVAHYPMPGRRVMLTLAWELHNH